MHSILFRTHWCLLFCAMLGFYTVQADESSFNYDERYEQLPEEEKLSYFYCIKPGDKKDFYYLKNAQGKTLWSSGYWIQVINKQADIEKYWAFILKDKSILTDEHGVPHCKDGYYFGAAAPVLFGIAVEETNYGVGTFSEKDQAGIQVLQTVVQDTQGQYRLRYDESEIICIELSAYDWYKIP